MISFEPRKQDHGGVTILFALLVFTLTVSVTAAVSYDLALDVRRTQSLLQQEQSRLVALGAEDWIITFLRTDQEETEDDHLGEIWAQPLPPLPVEGAGMSGVISGQITDLQGRFNLNNLLATDGTPDEVEVDRFERLLRNLSLNPQLADAVIDWMDADAEVRFPGGAEDDTYAARVPALLTANQPFRSADELAIIEGFDKAAFDALRPHVIALPERTLINANTATPFVLLALDDNVSGSDVERILEQRAQQGLENLEVAFAGLLPEGVIDSLTTQTQFFQLRSVVRIGTTRFTMYSLVFRDEQGESAVLLRSFGQAL